LTVTVRPATRSDPVRGGPVLAAIEKLTRPLPLPLAPEEIVIHGVLVVAVQAQPAAAVTSTPVAPPAAAGVSVSGLTVKVQLAAWLTVARVLVAADCAPPPAG
jgi:hypothetical protein